MFCFFFLCKEWNKISAVVTLTLRHSFLNPVIQKISIIFCNLGSWNLYWTLAEWYIRTSVSDQTPYFWQVWVQIFWKAFKNKTRLPHYFPSQIQNILMLEKCQWRLIRYICPVVYWINKIFNIHNLLCQKAAQFKHTLFEKVSSLGLISIWYVHKSKGLYTPSGCGIKLSVWKT